MACWDAQSYNSILGATGKEEGKNSWENLDLGELSETETVAYVIPGHAKGGMLVGTDYDGRSRSRGIDRQMALPARLGEWIPWMAPGLKGFDGNSPKR